MPFCEFCGQQLSEGQKCNCPKATEAGSYQKNTGNSVINEIPVQNAVPVQNTAAEQNTNPGSSNAPTGSSINTEKISESIKGAATALTSKFTKNQLITIGASAVAAIIIIFAVLSSFSGGYKKPLDSLCKGMEKGKGKYIVEAFLDKDMCEESSSKKAEYDELVELFDGMDEALEDEYGKHIKVSYDITKKKELTKRELNKYKDEYEDNLDIDTKITKGYKLTVKLKIKGKDDDDTNKTSMTVLKFKGHGWKLSYDSMDSIY